MSAAPPPTSALRSLLYIPGANRRALEKAAGLAADAVILDLEDAVAPDAKPAARETVCGLTGAFVGKVVTIRVNAIGTPWHEADVDAVATSGADAVVVPKVGSVADVTAVERRLVAAGAPESLRIWPMVESPQAILHAPAIAAASPRVAMLVMGVNDLVQDLRARHVPGRAPVLPHLVTAVLAARAAGVEIADGVYNAVRDPEGFAAEVAQGRDLGFTAKTLIHPSQVEPCNAAFTPTEAEVAEAREVIAAWEEALADGRGVATVNGRMIENLHVADARRVLGVVEALAARSSG